MNLKITTQPLHTLLTLVALSLTACGGGGSNSDDTPDGGNATHSITISENFNVDAGEPVLVQQQYTSFSNGTGIARIQTASSADAQPDNGYTASTIDIVDTASNGIERTIDFAAQNLDENATAAQLAAFINQQGNQQDNYIDASASTSVRVLLSATSLTFDDTFSLNGTTVTGDSIDDIMSAIDRLPSITASVNSNSEIFVTATDGNDLRIDLSEADINNTGTTATITSYVTQGETSSDIDSVIIGDNQEFSRATIGGIVQMVMDFPYQLSNAGSGNIFGATLAHTYTENNTFVANDPNTYNHATSIGITDSLGEPHVLTQYFVKAGDLGGLYPNRWNLYVMIDGLNAGPPGTNGEPTLATYDIFFDTNGQLDTTQTDAIEISAWVPADDNGIPNGAATTRITIDIDGSTQFGGGFSMQNVDID